ncbi:MAG: hypothetical protein JNM18_01885 [Planctomycetaceae bacterium]|nr:hypothetical protein [Planctomycetaceae bacterium]
MDTNHSEGTLDRFFSGLTEQTFQSRLGVADPPLVDYISRLLARFLHSDQIYKLRRPDGRRLTGVAEMLLEAETRVGAPKREVHRHIGDFTLFWTGLFPEALSGQRRQMRLDALLDYRQQGKRAYFIASTLPADDNPAENDVLERLSHEFDLCCYGLNELRKEWEQREGGEGERPVILG